MGDSEEEADRPATPRTAPAWDVDERELHLDSLAVASRRLAVSNFPVQDLRDDVSTDDYLVDAGILVNQRFFRLAASPPAVCETCLRHRSAQSVMSDIWAHVFS